MDVKYLFNILAHRQNTDSIDVVVHQSVIPGYFLLFVVSKIAIRILVSWQCVDETGHMEFDLGKQERRSQL